MAPKTRSSQSDENKSKTTQRETRSERSEPKHRPSSSSSRKRKTAPSSITPKSPAKAKKSISNQSSKALKTIHFLLSPASLPLCQTPKSDIPSSTSSNNVKEYFSPNLTPFEHLLCALVLSKPLSHTLGQRTIKTTLNAPYNFTSAQAIVNAGKENAEGISRVWEAIEDARTQRRQKTADQLRGMAETVVSEKWDEDGDGRLRGLLGMIRGVDMQGEIRRLLKRKVKGVGDTGVDIFVRRVQGVRGWEGVGWFVDGKTASALKELGLPGDGDGVKRLVEESGEGNVRGAFVVVLERALGIVLEGNQKELRSEIEKGG